MAWIARVDHVKLLFLSWLFSINVEIVIDHVVVSQLLLLLLVIGKTSRRRVRHSRRHTHRAALDLLVLHSIAKCLLACHHVATCEALAE